MNNDLIYRQTAIDAIQEMPNCPNGYSDTYDKEHIIAVLEEVPAAQPDFDAYCDKLWKLAYERGKGDAQANIVQCKDCKWRRNQNGTMAWIPCRALVTPDDFYCKYAERKEQ